MTSVQVPDTIIKITQAMGFLLNLDDNHKLNRVKLMKLLWAADRIHLRRYGRTITGDDYFAMRFGPVPSLAYDISKLSNNDNAFDPDAFNYLSEYLIADDYNTAMVKNPGKDHLSDTDKSALSEAWEKFGNMYEFDLANDISHKYPEWAKFSDFFIERHGNGRKHMDIVDFFNNPPEDKYFSEPQQLIAATKEKYLTHQKTQAMLLGA